MNPSKPTNATDAAVALAVDGHAVQWHRDPDGSVVIGGPMAQDAVAA